MQTLEKNEKKIVQNLKEEIKLIKKPRLREI